MFYHILIETNQKLVKSQTNKKYFELDKANLFEIEEDIVIPWLQKKEFQFDGYFLNPNDIVRLVIKQSNNTTKEYSEYENKNVDSNIFMYISPKDIFDFDNYMLDITKTVMASAREQIGHGIIQSTTLLPFSKSKEVVNSDFTKIFVVHGQDETVKLDVARFIEKLGFEAIILHEQVSSGKTIIEKIEEFSNVGFGVVLYTPCDIGAKRDNVNDFHPRARQNVVFEHGYLIAKLGRQNVCALVKGKTEIPNDISGVVYVQFDEHKAWKMSLAKEMRNSGYIVDMNLIF